jgi:hypothetical protein
LSKRRAWYALSISLNARFWIHFMLYLVLNVSFLLILLVKWNFGYVFAVVASKLKLWYIKFHQEIYNLNYLNDLSISQASSLSLITPSREVCLVYKFTNHGLKPFFI